MFKNKGSESDKHDTYQLSFPNLQKGSDVNKIVMYRYNLICKHVYVYIIILHIND